MSDREEMQRQCALRALVAEWRRSADEDERYLNKAHASEIHDVYASIRIGREHADALEAAYPAIRQQIAEEIAAKGDEIAEEYQRKAVEHRDLSDRQTPQGQRHWRTACAFRDKAAGAWEVAHAAREIGTRDAS